MPGWTAPTKGVRRFDDLPDAARAYIRRLEEVSGVPAAIISTGSDRDDTIVRDDSVVASWFAGSTPAASDARRSRGPPTSRAPSARSTSSRDFHVP